MRSETLGTAAIRLVATKQPLPGAGSSCHRQVLQHMLCETYKLLNEANRSIGYTPASDDDYAEAWASFVASWG